MLISDQVASKIEDVLSELYKTDIKIVILPTVDQGAKKQEDQLYFKRLKATAEKAMGVDVLSEK